MRSGITLNFLLTIFILNVFLNGNITLRVECRKEKNENNPTHEISVFLFDPDVENYREKKTSFDPKFRSELCGESIPISFKAGNLSIYPKKITFYQRRTKYHVTDSLYDLKFTDVEFPNDVINQGTKNFAVPLKVTQVFKNDTDAHKYWKETPEKPKQLLV